MPVNNKIQFILLSFIVFISIAFTTCDSPLGMGDPIDFEPPVLTLNPKPPTPFYVGLGAQLTGTVKDNIGVDRVILRDSVSGKQIFKANLLSNNRWEINLTFSSEQNGETILADVVAFDKMDNSGAESIASVVLIIDIHPPIVEDIWIRRSSTKTNDIESYLVLKELEETDPNGELIKNVNKYQNGAFYVEAKISEKESRIKSVLLKFYDSEEPDVELISLNPLSGSSIYNPKWLITEDMILDAGTDKLTIANYKSNYKYNNERYYYRLRIVATDYSDNESGSNEEGVDRIEDKGYLCLWNKADFPKGYLDPLVVGEGYNITAVKGSTLPAEFFDDDKIDWAYDALFTKEQWEGTKPIASGSYILGLDDNERFRDLEDKLRKGVTVYNWNYDRHLSLFSDPDKAKKEQVVNLVPADGADEKTHLSLTGNGDTDYGDYVFITMVKDKKLPPHEGNYPAVTKYRKYNVTLVDENAPLIVFDKTADRLPVGTPEENTFPTLTADGKFKIHGYTLREDKTLKADSTGGLNSVVKFRIAWVPYALASTDNNAENIVKVALKKSSPQDSDFPPGVQWWNLDADISASCVQDKIGDSIFRKQYFEKEFSILGDTDNKNSAYDNFTRVKGDKTTFENTTKLFIFYAEDNVLNPVTRQFYLLGNKTLPAIEVYDITDKLTMPASPSIPDVFDYGAKDGLITSDYITARNTYNQNAYPTLKPYTTSLSDNDKTDPFRVYPRGTTIKLWANASANGALGIASIKMEDITFEGAAVPIGYYNTTNQDLGYVEYFREVTQRVFLFTATDKLGNEAKAQRTIAIANAAALISITTPKQNGTYPMYQKAGDEIELRANFDGMVKLEKNDNGTRPKLNVMYKIGKGAETSLSYGVAQIECEPVNSPTLYLTFNFKVPEDAKGKLLTVYKGIPNKPASNTSNPAGFPSIPPDVFAAIDRPITLTDGNNIIDSVRNDSAYTPGNVTGFYWDNADHSLQQNKTITLDGELPRITGISMIKTKKEYGTFDGITKWYLKSGESISFQITANKLLKVKGDTTTALRFRLQRPGTLGYTGYNTSAFDYRNVTGSMVVFTLDVNKQNIPNDGILQNDITLVNPGNITDEAGNPVVESTFAPVLNTFTNGKTVYFDLTPPVRPVTNLTGANDTIEVGTSQTQSEQTMYFNTTPRMAIANPNATDEPYETELRQYSLNGGLNWVDFPSVVNTTALPWTSAVTGSYSTIYILNGQWSLKTRFIDRAGNEGATTNQLINVNNIFPKLIGVTAVQPNATYNTGTLQFKLDFDDIVTAANSELPNITISLKDTSASKYDPTVSASIPFNGTGTISPAAVSNNRTLTFSWTLDSDTNKDMLNGLSLNTINISGLEDRFGNRGPTNISVTNTGITVTYVKSPGPPIVNDTYTVSYDISGVKVSTIRPTVTNRAPDTLLSKSGDVRSSVSADNKTITLTFSKSMQKGNGTITIRPHAGYAIPAVFENDGYYITYTYDGSGNINGETKSSTAAAGSTYVSGFYDIFNSINNTDRGTLIGGTLMSAPALSNVTGLSVGPYLKTTHGLTQGAGYTGNYGNTPTGQTASVTKPGINAPGTRGTDYMIPDVETKWVLAYNYGDLFSTSAGTVSNIRAVLDRAKFRWQEIAVTNPSVTISGNTVTIILSEPLLPGLQWDVYYPEGTFTDTAGNKAYKSGNFDGANGLTGNTTGVNNDYWFWSRGVQKPVIRVDRKSYDARAGGNNADYRGSMFGKNQTYNNTNAHNGDIDSFNIISYRITSETPNARIEYTTKEGKTFTAGTGANEVTIGSIIAKWTGRVTTQTLTDISNTDNITWNGPKATPADTTGTWVRPNLIFRCTENGTYNIMEDGINISKAVRGIRDTRNGFGNNDNNNRFYGFRSYNKDATFSELNSLTPSSLFTSGGTASFTYDSTFGLEASKNYVVAQARIDHVLAGGTYNSANAISSQKGFEGVFRTVVALNNTSLVAAGSNGAANIIKGVMNTNDSGAVTTVGCPIMVDGSNVRSGMPTISGFPVRDNGCDSDSRYTKVFYRNETTNTTDGLNGKQFYWVSSEIISPWYIQPYGKGNGAGSHGKTGDVEDWITAGYGDLTYVLNLATW
jgi:hypothetical protein